MFTALNTLFGKTKLAVMKKFLWRYDKQFGTNTASLFIFEFAFQANIMLFVCGL